MYVALKPCREGGRRQHEQDNFFLETAPNCSFLSSVLDPLYFFSNILKLNYLTILDVEIYNPKVHDGWNVLSVTRACSVA